MTNRVFLRDPTVIDLIYIEQCVGHWTIDLPCDNLHNKNKEDWRFLKYKKLVVSDLLTLMKGT